jgi:hypothetical protein
MLQPEVSGPIRSNREQSGPYFFPPAFSRRGRVVLWSMVWSLSSPLVRNLHPSAAICTNLHQKKSAEPLPTPAPCEAPSQEKGISSPASYLLTPISFAVTPHSSSCHGSQLQIARHSSRSGRPKSGAMSSYVELCGAMSTKHAFSQFEVLTAVAPGNHDRVTV